MKDNEGGCQGSLAPRAGFNVQDWQQEAMASAAAGFQKWQRKRSAEFGEHHLHSGDDHVMPPVPDESAEALPPGLGSAWDSGTDAPPQTDGGEHAISGIMSNERCNVVLTHVNADFDSLAGAVALAKLWTRERPALKTYVVIPRGVNPVVARFLAYHKHLLPVRGFKTIRAEDIAAVGVVDTQMRDRLGPAAAWLDSAEHVAVVDHHTHALSTIDADEFICEPVGSATTVLVERLQAHYESGAPKAALTEAEATLCALGIRTDTGALAFPATTTRDAYALAWLMGQVPCQGRRREWAVSRQLASTVLRASVCV